MNFFLLSVDSCLRCRSFEGKASKRCTGGCPGQMWPHVRAGSSRKGHQVSTTI